MTTLRSGGRGGDGVENEWLSSEESRRNFVAKYPDTDGGCSVVGLYGWRRRILFLVISILLILVILNLGLTLWMLKVMEFTANGLGPLKVLPRGLQLHGEAMILDSLIATKIRSRKGQPLQLRSSKNISLQSRTPNGKMLSQLFLGDGKLEAIGSSLRVSDVLGKTLFSVDKKEVTVGAESVTLTGEGGAIVTGSIQTPKVKAESGHELRLESPTRSLEISGTFGVSLLSGAGDITATSLGDLKLQSQSGSVQLEARHIYFPKLETVSVSNAKIPTAGAPVSSNRPSKPINTTPVYQVCICEKGRLFLAPPDGDCVADNDVCR